MTAITLSPPHGRGAFENPQSRFDATEIAYDDGEEPGRVRTRVFHDKSKSIIATNDSPDVGFSCTINPYRGCEHGCIYCYARPTHEYLGLSAGVDFESKIFAKLEAPALLRQALAAKSWHPQALGISGVTDCYQPAERKLELTRKCLEVLLDFRNPGVIITKNHLVTRDIDILQQLAAFQAIHVVISLTTLDKDLARKMEPRACAPHRRLEAIQALRAANIPVSVNMAPIVPGLTDHEIHNVLEAASQAGAQGAHYTLVRLPYGVKDLFQTWLDEHYPLRKNKVLHRIQEIRGGKLNNSEFGKRMQGEGIFAQYVEQVFSSARKQYGLDKPSQPLSTKHFRNPTRAEQLMLF